MDPHKNYNVISRGCAYEAAYCIYDCKSLDTIKTRFETAKCCCDTNECNAPNWPPPSMPTTTTTLMKTTTTITTTTETHPFATFQPSTTTTAAETTSTPAPPTTTLTDNPIGLGLQKVLNSLIVYVSNPRSYKSKQSIFTYLFIYIANCYITIMYSVRKQRHWSQTAAATAQRWGPKVQTRTTWC